MFGQYFGQYLVDRNKISQTDLDNVLKQVESLRLRLGTIAVAERLLSKKQAEEINSLQRQVDKRFGDIAIEKGYLLTEEVNYLVNLQGNSYLKFVQALMDANLLTLDDIDFYLEEYKHEHHFTDYELECLKSGDIDRIIPLFLDSSDPYVKECISLGIRNLLRFISSNLLIKPSYYISKYDFGSLSCQQMIGDKLFFVGFASKDDELLEIANPFAKETFEAMNDESFDSVCEFINCINGLYASKLSYEDIQVDMTPPLFYQNKSIECEDQFIVVPILINGRHCDYILATKEVQIN